MPTMGTVTHTKLPQSPRVAAYERQLKYLTSCFYEALGAADLRTVETVTLQMVTVSERLGAARHGLQLERLIMGTGYEDEPLPPDDAILDVVVEHADAVHPEWDTARPAVEAPA
jgi:hypothetical protein